MTDMTKLERLAASITGGKWIITYRRDNLDICGVIGEDDELVCGDVQIYANARAIALVPDLLAEVIALRAEVERLETRATAADEAHVLLQRAVDLIRGDLVGGEWKKACNEFVKDALRALSGEKS